MPEWITVVVFKHKDLRPVVIAHADEHQAVAYSEIYGPFSHIESASVYRLHGEYR